MGVLVMIDDPRVIQQILSHLGLPSDEVRPDPSQPPPDPAADLFADARA